MKVKFKARLAFPALYKAKSFAGSSDSAKFSATLLIDKEDTETIKQITKAMKEVSLEKWSTKGETNYKALAAAGKTCLRDGDSKAEYEGFDGCMFVSASNNVKPTTVDKARNIATEESGLLYAGCNVVAIIDVWAQDNQFGKRINATLAGVQFHSDGDAFSGSAPAAVDDFDELEASDDDDSDLFA